MQTRLELPFRAPGAEDVAPLSALYEEGSAGARRGGLLLAHGAGYGMESPFMARLAQGLVELGFGVLRFNYPYRERALRAGKRMLPTDPRAVLEAAHALALAELARRSGDPRPWLAGKSLGARVSTLLAAKDEPCRGLVLFGYPLHPAGQPEKERSEHFPAIAQPALFLQGTRDDLCDVERLQRALARFGGPVALELLETADHSFKTLKKSKMSEDDVFAWLLERVDRFATSHP
jgi:predicted alpha/beta-hydrolase family hydrolase